MPLEALINGLAKSTVLTQREKEVLLLLNQGLSTKAIANKLFISYETVKKHLKNIYSKLEVCNKLEALNKIKES